MITKIKKLALSFSIVLSIAVVLPAPLAMAASSTCNPKPPQTVAFFPAWYDGMLCADGNIMSPGDSSLGNDTGHRFGKWIAIIAMNLVRMLLYVVGYASLIFIIYGGFKYMTQGDNANGTAAARKTIQNAIIGLVISILSVSIVTFITGRITG